MALVLLLLLLLAVAFPTSANVGFANVGLAEALAVPQVHSTSSNSAVPQEPSALAINPHPTSKKRRGRQPPPPPSPPPPPPPFHSDQIDYFQLVLQWPDNLCRTKNCQPKGVSLPQRFTIHGLWPEGAHGTTLGPCSASIMPGLPGKIMEDLRIYWPNVKDRNQDTKFWIEQWNKHGSCTQPMFTPRAYFERAVQLCKDLNILKMLDDAGIRQGMTHLTAANVRGSFSNKPHINKPIVSCKNATNTNKNYLVELRFCLTRDTNAFFECNEVQTGCNPEFEF